MTPDVWVTYEPSGDCQCWRDVVCPHGWTWQEEVTCCHEDGIMDDVHESFADAVRSLFQVDGSEPIGFFLRERYKAGLPHTTSTVYVMRPEDRPAAVDDHFAISGPTPYRIIVRKALDARSRPGDAFRRFMDGYRGR